jgi:hypothetical protein
MGIPDYVKLFEFRNLYTSRQLKGNSKSIFAKNVTFMNTKRFYQLLLAVVAISASVKAQPVSRTVIAEHYTNTYCSICASRNPGLYTNLRNHPQVLHIAYHPSAPYAACPLSMHNVSENNARTNFYGIFGGTPRLVIQGSVISASANYADAALYTSVLGQTTPFGVTVTLMPQGADSVVTRVVVKKHDTSSLTSLQLYGALAEDTLFFTAANGEPRSYDVFRRAVWGSTSLSITAPAAVGDSVVFNRTTAVNAVWVRSRMYAIVMLQDDDKNMLQAARSANLPSAAATPHMTMTGNVTAFPNPANDKIWVKATDSVFPLTYTLYEPTGRQIQHAVLEQTQSYIDIAALPKGLYTLKLSNGAAFQVLKN